MDASALREYLSGPAFEIEIHDRDRVVEKQKLEATLFGDDLDDDKISNVGVVAGTALPGRRDKLHFITSPKALELTLMLTNVIMS